MLRHVEDINSFSGETGVFRPSLRINFRTMTFTLLMCATNVPMKKAWGQICLQITLLAFVGTESRSIYILIADHKILSFAIEHIAR